MNNQVLFKRISGVNFAKLSSAYTVGAIYFIVSNPSTLSTVGNVKITKGQIWIAKSATEVELYTNGIKSANLVKVDGHNTSITLVDNFEAETSIDLKDLHSELVDLINNKTTNVYRYVGSKTIAELTALTTKNHGDVWNVKDTGTLSPGEDDGSVKVQSGDNVAWIVAGPKAGFWDVLASTVNVEGKQDKLVNNDVITVNGSKLTVGVDDTYITKTGNKLTLTEGTTGSLGKANTALQTITGGYGINTAKSGTEVTIKAVAATPGADGENYVEVVSDGIQTTAGLETRLKAIETSAAGGVQSVTQADKSIIVNPTGGNVKLKANYDNSGNVKLVTTTTGIKAELLWEEEIN